MGRPPVAPRATPRISVNDLALYMVSSQTAQIGIIRRSKYPQTPLITRYCDARRPIRVYLADPNRNLNPLVEAEEMLRQRSTDPAVSAHQQEDARLSIEVLHALQRMNNQLRQFQFIAPPNDQARLVLSGVEVSVRADVLAYGTTRAGIEQIGAAVLRMTQDDAESDGARARRREMGLYVATLARLHVDQNIQSNRTVANRLCMSIDVQHGEIFQAPDANTRRMNDVQSACQFIAAMWDGIQP